MVFDKTVSVNKVLSSLSVVVSGPILGTENDNHSFTRQACQSVRDFLPSAEIVLSTWKGESVEGISYDKLVQSIDPGPNEGNINRQICSRQAGIREASNEYVLCIRSESIIKNLNFLSYIDKYESHKEKCKFCFLKNRIVTPASYPAKRGELFHIGDWYFFGHKDDLLELWTIPYMDDSKFNNCADDIYYNPHRYLITSFVKKYYPLEFSKLKDINEKNKKVYESVLAENFVITGFYEYGITSLKYPLTGSFFNKLFHKEVGYTFNEWKELYNFYSGGKEVIKKSFSEIFMINVCVPIKRSILGRLFMQIRRKLFHLNYWE